MKKVFCVLLAIAMALCGIGCGAKEAVEETAPAEEAIADVKDEEVFLGEATADGLVPSGLIAIYLDGDDAYDRLGDFSVALGDMYLELINVLYEPIRYDYIGVGYTDTGAVLSCSLENTALGSGQSRSLTAEMERIEALAAEQGFNTGECRIEYDLATPPFPYSEGVMRNMFTSSRGGDLACIHAHFMHDNYIISEKQALRLLIVWQIYMVTL